MIPMFCNESACDMIRIDNIIQLEKEIRYVSYLTMKYINTYRSNSPDPNCNIIHPPLYPSFLNYILQELNIIHQYI